MDVFEKFCEKRIITVGRITPEFADKIGAALIKLSMESTDKEIRFLIDSGGGSVASTLSTCDLIKSLHTPVTGIVLGECFSMAVTLLQACGRRLAVQHARFLLHFASTNFEFSHQLSDEEIRKLFERRLIEGRRGQTQNEHFLATRTGRTVEEIRRLMWEGDEVDAKLSAYDALKIGLIDDIIEDPSGLFEESWSLEKALAPKKQ